ncbi:MAG TPA: hypothetical protein VK249_08675 [Anaerolineales bacterium]|nr:hypothetical protein [Anaerolineales bacterium]
MPVKILVTTAAPDSGKLELPNGRKTFDYLGDKNQSNPTVQIKEIVDKIFDEIRETVDFECGVEITLSGSLTLTGKGESKYLIFNVGGSAEATASMEVKLSTKLASKKKGS